MAPPRLIFGGAAIGSSYLTSEAVSELLETLKALNITRIDSAARYPPTNPGQSEFLLGKAKAGQAGFIIDTKILSQGDGSGSLTATNIEKSLNDSFDRLQIDKVNVLYCHQPDHRTPLAEQAAALNDQHKKGQFSVLGVSNFTPAMLQELIQICKNNNYNRPLVYQGQYNAICRRIEDTLFPVLRANGMTFTAYSPLAGGFLSGKLSAGDTAGTRFTAGNVMGDFFKAQYDKPPMHAALAELERATKPLNISGTEAALRWICFHSTLSAEDGVILGSSRLAQIEQNVRDIARGPLPDTVVNALEHMWVAVKNDAQ